MNNDLEEAISKLEEWLKPQCFGKRTLFVYPEQALEELNMDLAVFWYCAYKLKERQIIGFENRDYFGVHPAAIMIEGVA